MAWRMGQQIKVATPDGDVYVAKNRVHNHSSGNFVMFTIGERGNVIPFVVTEDLLKSEERFSGSLEQVMDAINPEK